MDTELESDVGNSADSSSIPDASGDPTQQLLTALGRFQRQLTDAPTSSDAKIWADECMDQLITAVDIAIGQGWSAMVEALTDTGRILQTYQNADRASDCIPFLNDAYEVLCLFVGDLIVDNESSAISENWRRLFDGAVRAVEATGLTLVSDDDDGLGGASAPDTPAGDSGEDDIDGILLPEEPAASDEIEEIGIIDNSIGLEDAPAAATPEVEELPTLDELPPLEDVLESGIESAGETAPPDLPSRSTEEPMELDLLSAGDPLEEAEAPGETPVHDLDALASPGELEIIDLDASADVADEETPGLEDIDLGIEPISIEPESLDVVPTPSASENRIVEILDTLCEHLAGIQDNTGDERALAIERFEDGVDALTREASDAGHDIAARLCALMRRAVELTKGEDGSLDDRVIDLGYAFCGVYMESASEGGNDDVAGWQRECQDLIAGFERAAESAGAEEPAETEAAVDDGIVTTIEIEVEPDIADAEIEESPEAAIEPVAEDAPAVDQIGEISTIEIADPAPADDAALEAETTDSVVEDIEETAPPQITIEELEAAVERADVAPKEAETPAPVADPEPELTKAAEPESAAVAEPAPVEPITPSVPEPESASAAPDSKPASEYEALLAAAGKAAASGDAAGAKFYALQAAAYVSRTELANATEKLSETERRLKENWDLTEDARTEVEKVEGDVRRAATEVVSTEQSMGEVRERVAEVAQEVDDIQGEIDDLDHQISELQARRDDRAESLEEAATRLKESEEAARDSEDVLDAAKKREHEARAFLESCRRNVKEKQRMTADVETEMAEAREQLAHRQQSCEEIEQTIKQICGDDVPQDKPDSMLF